MANSIVRRYKVAPKDNIFVIARRFNTSPEIIARLNANKGIRTTRSGWDFRPGSLLVGDYLIVPATGAGAPGAVKIKRSRGQRPQRLQRRARVNGLSDESCGEGWHAEEDFWGNVECIPDENYDWGGDGGGSDSGGSDGGDEDWKSYLSVPEVASAINAWQSGQDGTSYANSVSDNEVSSLSSWCGVLIFLAGLSVIGGPFVAAYCAALKAREASQAGSDTPSGGSSPQYPVDCGYGFYQAGPGEPCLFAGAGDSCESNNEDGKGYWVGTFDKDGKCIYDKQKTATANPSWLCNAPAVPVLDPTPGWGWSCLECGDHEDLLPATAECVCSNSYHRDSTGSCVQSSGTIPGGTPDKKPAKPVTPEKKPDKPSPITPTVEKKDWGNTPYYAAAGVFGVLALWLATRKGKGKKLSSCKVDRWLTVSSHFLLRSTSPRVRSRHSLKKWLRRLASPFPTPTLPT